MLLKIQKRLQRAFFVFSSPIILFQIFLFKLAVLLIIDPIDLLI